MRLDLDRALTTEIWEPKWIVEGIIPASTLIMIAGDAGVGKSVMNLTEAFHVALGLPFFGHPTVQQRVLYFDEENSFPDINAYLQQIWIGLGQPDKAVLKENLFIEHFSLGTPHWPELMRGVVQQCQPGIVYIETATSALDVDEENSNSEAQNI